MTRKRASKKRKAPGRRPEQRVAGSRRATTSAPSIGSWKQVDRIQLAQLLGVHPDTVTDFTRRGMPVVERGGAGKTSAYDAVDCLAWWRSSQGKNIKDAAQARALAASAELNEIKIAREQGALIPRDQVVLEGQHYTKAWTAKVRALPRRFVQEGLLTRELEVRAAAMCRELLNEIASWKTMADTKPVSDAA